MRDKMDYVKGLFTWADAELAARLILSAWMFYLITKMENPSEPVAYLRYHDAFVSILLVTCLVAILHLKTAHDVAVFRRDINGLFDRTLFPVLVKVEMILSSSKIIIAVVPGAKVEGVTIESVYVKQDATGMWRPLTIKWLQQEMRNMDYFIPKSTPNMDAHGIYSATFDGGANMLSQAAIRRHFEIRQYKLEVTYTIVGLDTSFRRDFPILFPE